MSSRMPVSQGQLKLAEKLSILNDRGTGMLARLYNIKKACQDPKSRPAFLSEKSLESCLKSIVRKFPHTEKNAHGQLSPIDTRKAEILKVLSVYYMTFRDILEYKDHVSELLTVIATCNTNLDITCNFDMTKNYLDLVVKYVSILLLLARVEDRKAMLGLYNTAYDLANQRSEPSFARLGTMIMEYEHPMKKLAEEFIPLERCVASALFSLLHLYPRRNLTAEQWRSQEMLSLVAKPNVLLNPAQSETMRCEYLSLDTLERWIIIGFMVCPTLLTTNERALALWRPALQSSYCITLCRDEVLIFHKYIEVFFTSIKGFSKKAQEVKDAATHALNYAPGLHKERRKFLRTALKELITIISDQPGLLGPKALYVFMGLAFARDEILWLVRHTEHPHPKLKNKPVMDDLVDHHLPELLFYIEELRGLVKKYFYVLQDYYIQYLNGYDAIVLNNIVKSLTMCPEDESIILSSFVQTLESLNVKQVKEGPQPDFTGFRLDWFRLQAYTSISRATLVLGDNTELARTMNTIIFHTLMVDAADEVLLETSDLSIFCHHSRIFERNFEMSLGYPTQSRFAVAFPLICAHFINCTHELCPEERFHVGERSLSVTNAFLDRLAKEVKDVVTRICSEQCNLSDQLLPKNAAPLHIKHELQRKTKQNVDKNRLKTLTENPMPGTESFRKTRENLTEFDRLHISLSELCTAINYSAKIMVWEHTFSPREYLIQHLEARFAKALVGMMMYSPDTNEIAKPSELLTSVRTYMNVLQSIESYVQVDITRVFNNVMLQQTQQQDSHGEKTITMLYTNWYLEVFLRKVTTCHIIYSPHQKAFISLAPDKHLPFNAEEYTDVTELRSLAELIGAYGMKFLHESLMWHIASQMGELKKLVLENREVLTQLRTNFDKPDVMAQLSVQLKHIDNLLMRLNIIGIILAFKSLTQEALSDVLARRVPFLYSAIIDFKEHVRAAGQDAIIVDTLANSVGLSCNVDPALVSALRSEKEIDPESDYTLSCLLMVFIAVSLRTLARQEGTVYHPVYDLSILITVTVLYSISVDPESDYTLSCLLMVFIAVSLRTLARQDGTVYHPMYDAHPNNCHCYAKAINAIAGALFSLHGRGDVEERLQEFLALTSSNMLHLGQETDKAITVKGRESLHLLLDQIVKESPFLTQDLLESCFPYALLRNAYHTVLKRD
ncbi:nck-associated protein 1-like isoform X2 [Lytechinus variegatus]|uniref:nck-associated protein 1-like isoform X2 n=1 Tax=Lytechinus variegatus TaxID=7654 RepID=UPI001BB17956|nr:nck-associated protein 1-like isoform X2 [Lytechinus variegatus]